MNIEAVTKILKVSDGSLPDINFDFNGEECVSSAYQYIQGLSSELVSSGSYYWSKSDPLHQYRTPKKLSKLTPEVIHEQETNPTNEQKIYS